MAVGTEVVAVRYEDIVAGTPISVPYPVYEALDVLVYYGAASLQAVFNTDYTVSLADDFDTFTLTPTASLLTKINNLIAANPADEVNYITVRRRLDYLTDSTAAAVRYTPFTSREFERTVLRFQQIQEQLNRCISLSPNFVGDEILLELQEVLPNRTLQTNMDGTRIIAGPTADEVANAQEYANQAIVAQGLAEDARDASIIAQGLSEDARDASVIAKGLSESARDASIAAQGLSEDARDASVIAQGLSEDARDASIVAQGLSEDARDAAVIAQGLAEDARDEAVNRVENAAGAVRHDVVQTLTDGAKLQARVNVQAADRLTESGFLYKAAKRARLLDRTGNGTLSIKAGTIVEVDGNIFNYANAEAITMPSLSAGDDVAVWVRPDGQPVATLDHVSPPVANSRMIGGGHYAPGGNAAAQAGGNTTAQFNPYSLWDEKFRPVCLDPRGMSLIADEFWCDIYLLGVDHHINGTSRYNVTIADGSSPPKIPTLFGGNGSTAYDSLTWWEAAEVMKSHAKQLLDYAEFAAAMYGTTEGSGGGTDPVSTILRQAYTSKWGIMLATGNLWVRGRDFGGPFAAASWSNTAGGRGQVYNQSSVALFGGDWSYSAEAGSRTSSWVNLPSSSGSNFSARGRSDHLILV